QSPPAERACGQTSLSTADILARSWFKRGILLERIDQAGMCSRVHVLAQQPKSRPDPQPSLIRMQLPPQTVDFLPQIYHRIARTAGKTREHRRRKLLSRKDEPL